MKRIKTALLALVMVFMMTLTGFSAIEANALVPSYNGDDMTVYYFTDYYQSLEEDVLAEEFDDFNVIYDHQWVTEQEFNDMVDDHYFTGFGDDCIVVIDIKTFMPDPDVLLDLFQTLKVTYNNCGTVLVSPYSSSDYDSEPFLNYVDVVFQSNFERLRSFIYNTYRHITDTFNNTHAVPTLENVTMLIDGRLIDLSGTYNDIDDLCIESPFLRILLEEFADRLPGSYTYDSYSEIADEMSEDGINLLLHTGGEDFVNVITGGVYEDLSYTDLQDPDQFNWDYICGIGFWDLETSFKTFLSDTQGHMEYMPLYLLEVDPMIYGGSLVVITDGMLAMMYDEPYVERERLLELLKALRNAILNNAE